MPEGHLRLHPSIASQMTGGIWVATQDGYHNTVDLMGHASAVSAKIQALDFDRIKAISAHRVSGIWAMGDDYFEPSTDTHVLDAVSGAPAKIGILPIVGLTIPKGAWCVQGYDDIERSGNALIAEGVEDIVIKFGTLGGSFTGIKRMCEVINAWKDQVRVTGVADHNCCSAGIIMASQCHEFYASEDSSVGSAGVYMPWVDMSGALRAKGIRSGYIYHGEFKIAGAQDDTETSDEVKAQARREIFIPQSKAAYDWLVSMIASGRGDRMDERSVRDTKARCYSGQAAVDVGFADGVSYFDEVVSDLLEIS